MTDSLEQKLIECLDALERGESLEIILSRYADDAAQLRPFLETAVQLEQLPIQPTVVAQKASKQTFLEQAAAMKAGPASPPFWQKWGHRLRPAAALAMFLILFFAGFGYASATAVPGDILYNSKRFIENARLQAASPLQKIELAERFNQERITEINQLLAAGREEEVSFYGFIEAIVDDTLTIADLTILLDENTEIEGEVAVGYFAEVNGRTQNNIILATSISIASPHTENDPTPAPQPTQASTAQATPPTSTGTSPPTVTLTATATTTATPTANITHSPTPTITPVPSETAVPLPTIAPTTLPATPDDDNDNNDDDGNDNDDDDDNDNNDDDDNDNNDDDDNDNDND